MKNKLTKNCCLIVVATVACNLVNLKRGLLGRERREREMEREN